MASSKFELNLRSLVGVELMNVKMADGKVHPCWCIPADFNGMVRPNKEGKNEIFPNIHGFINTAGAKFRESCKTRHIADPNYVAPTHTVSVSYNKDFRDRALASAEARIRRENPSMGEEDVKRQAKYAVDRTIAYLTFVTDEQRGYAPAEGNAQAEPIDPSQYMAPQSSNTDMAPQSSNTDMAPQSNTNMAGGPVDVDDDLPF